MTKHLPGFYTRVDLSSSEIINYSSELAQREAFNYEENDMMDSRFSPEDIASSFLGVKAASDILKKGDFSRPWKTMVNDTMLRLIRELVPMTVKEAELHYTPIMLSSLAWRKKPFFRLEVLRPNMRVEPVLAPIDGAKAPDWLKTPDFDFYPKVNP